MHYLAEDNFNYPWPRFEPGTTLRLAGVPTTCSTFATKLNLCMVSIRENHEEEVTKNASFGKMKDLKLLGS
jgi:hypothetical protein